jgi:hypothetical protein
VTRPPVDVADLAAARTEAREARDWAEADRLKAAIEAAGWKVVDRGLRSVLSPVGLPDVVDGDRVRYGGSAAVPSRLAERASATATVVVRATDDAAALGRLLGALRAHAPDGTQVVVVADAPSEAVSELLTASDGPSGAPIGGWDPELIWTVTRLGVADATMAGLRRAVGRVAILLDPGLALTGDAVTPLVDALDDPSVAVAGAWGRVSSDLRRWEPAAPGDVAAIDGVALAFRRDDLIARGPLDAAFQTDRHLDTWWSLVLRDEGEGVAPLRAIRLADLPLARDDRHDDAEDDASGPPRERDRLERRAFYRLVRQFGRRRDLLVGGPVDRGSGAT